MSRRPARITRVKPNSRVEAAREDAEHQLKQIFVDELPHLAAGSEFIMLTGEGVTLSAFGLHCAEGISDKLGLEMEEVYAILAGLMLGFVLEKW